MSIDLRFGYRQLPEGVTTAWGARWIIHQGGDVDQVWDRQDACGPDDKRKFLLEHLSTHVGDAPRQQLSALLRSYKLRTNDEHEVTLYGDDTVVVVGSPQRSSGYFYVAAYLREEVSNG